MKILLRLIAFPFFSAVALLSAIVQWVVYSVNFIKYGGEAVAFTKKTRPKTITDVYMKVEDMINSQTTKEEK